MTACFGSRFKGSETLPLPRSWSRKPFWPPCAPKTDSKVNPLKKTWLFAILKHKIIDHFRSKKFERSGVNTEDYAERTDKFFGENGKWRIQPSNWDVNPVEAYEQKEFMDAFYQCPSGMPQRLADAFVYREIDGLSAEEICKVLAITPTNCWVILYLARMLLRRCIEINWTQTTA